MDKPVKVRLHIMSPLHIGCDDAYEPTSFVIDEKKERLIEFDPMDFIKTLGQRDREEFSKKCMADNLLDIFKFIKAKYNTSTGGREIDICKDLSEHYKKVLKLNIFNKNVVINQFTISKTAYNPHNGSPYIPGSSLKGAMRTAYLTKLCNEQSIERCWERYLDQRDLRSEQDIHHWIRKKNTSRKLEEELLGGNFDADPFRMVKVSDFLPVENVRTKIVYAVNRKKRRSERPTRADSGPPQILEVIQDGAVFEGVINIQQPIGGSGINRPVEEISFLKSINDFYRKLLNDEKNVTKEISVGHIDIRSFDESQGKSAFLIRIGRHSGAEAVTIEGNRHIKIMQAKEEVDKYLDRATTIWLASDNNKPANNSSLIPFGWAVLELLPFNIENLYPTSTITEKVVLPESDETLPRPEIKHTSPDNVSQTTLWQNASLTWSPGNRTLATTKGNKKAEIKLAGNRDIVPEPFRKRLFEKRKAVTANVTVEAVGGNLFRIVKIEVP